MGGQLADKRILVVEDEYFIASDMKRALEEQDALVVGPVAGLDKAMDLVEDGRLDGAILDVNLDGAASFPIADRLRAAGVPYMFVTGYDDWALPVAYRQDTRLAKPFHMNSVLDTLDALLAKGASS